MDAKQPRIEARPDGDVGRLARARVLIVGVGALGSPAAWQLAAAGVGTLLLADPDNVEISNLPRQLLYGVSAVGGAKVERAARSLRRAGAGARIETLRAAVTPDNAAALIGDADFTIDASDGVATKFTVNDAAVAARRAYCHAGVLGFRGQLLTVHPGQSACLRCLFPEPPGDDEIATCRSAGIAGPVAGIIGALQAAAAITFLLGRSAPADGLLTFDGRTSRWRRIALRRNPRCPVCASPAETAGIAAAAYGN